MTDLHPAGDIHDKPPAPRTAVTTTLWVVAGIGLACNAVLSIAGHPWISNACGVVAGASLVTLLVRHLRARRRS